jgi:hypothetical protein
MIRYALICDRKHEFDIWFSSSGDYDKQRKRGLVTCPVCDSKKVAKAIMAPAIGRAGRKDSDTPGDAALPAAATATSPAEAVSVPGTENVAMVSPQEVAFRAKLKELRDTLVQNAENVGKKFPETARKMHYGEIEHRSIYGEASPQEAKEMHDEGIDFHPLPVLPDDRN